MNGQENSSSSMLCANGCGFYGNPTTKNLCSKCYREFVKVENQMKQQQQQQQLPAESVGRPSAAPSAPVMTSPSDHQSNSPDAEMSTATTAADQLDFPLFAASREPTTEVAPANSIATTALIEQQAGAATHPAVPPRSLSDPNPSVIVGSLNFSRPNSEGASAITDPNSNSSAPATPSSSSRVTNLGSSIVSTDHANAPGSESGLSVEDEASGFCAQKNKERCFECNKKVGLLGFQCRCGYNFCGSHRHADQHNCQFDYRELARQQLSRANQKVVADKLNRI